MEIELSDNGAWCWFQDRRAIRMDDQLVFSSITDQGTVRVSTCQLSSGETSHAVLREQFDVDDHNVPGLLLRDDGHLMAFYARHGREARMYHRTSTLPGDARNWGPEQVYNAQLEDRFCYANPIQLQAERGRIYNFWRGRDWNPTFSYSDDLGNTWADGRNVIYFRKAQRPYVKYASNGQDTIHFAFIEAHPHDAELATSLYHAFYREGQLHRSDGAAVQELAAGPLTPGQATRVYDATGNPLGKAWVWDVALDAEQHPVIVYNTCLGPEDHRYRYARWDAAHGQWRDQQIAYAGRCLYEREAYYSGGICLDPTNPAVVYLSANVNPQDGSPNASGRYELHRGEMCDGGQSWRWRSLTPGAMEDYLRPVVPADHADAVCVLAMKGRYVSYTDYRTRIVLIRESV